MRIAYDLEHDGEALTISAFSMFQVENTGLLFTVGCMLIEPNASDIGRLKDTLGQYWPMNIAHHQEGVGGEGKHDA